MLKWPWDTWHIQQVVSILIWLFFFSGNYLYDVITLGSSSFPWDAPVHRISFGISWLSNEDVLLKFPNGPKRVREFLPKMTNKFWLKEKKHHPERWKEPFCPPAEVETMNRLPVSPPKNQLAWVGWGIFVGGENGIFRRIWRWSIRKFLGKFNQKAIPWIYLPHPGCNRHLLGDAKLNLQICVQFATMARGEIPTQRQRLSPFPSLVNPILGVVPAFFVWEGA